MLKANVGEHEKKKARKIEHILQFAVGEKGWFWDEYLLNNWHRLMPIVYRATLELLLHGYVSDMSLIDQFRGKLDTIHCKYQAYLQEKKNEVIPSGLEAPGYSFAQPVLHSVTHHSIFLSGANKDRRSLLAVWLEKDRRIGHIIDYINAYLSKEDKRHANISGIGLDKISLSSRRILQSMVRASGIDTFKYAYGLLFRRPIQFSVHYKPDSYLCTIQDVSENLYSTRATRLHQALIKGEPIYPDCVWVASKVD